MVRRYLLCSVAFVILLQNISAQESLGDIARKLKAQKAGAQSTAAAPPAAQSATPAPATDSRSAAISAAISYAQSMPDAPAAAPEQEQPITANMNPDFATDAQAIDKYVAAIRQLVQQEKFEELDRIAHEARSTKARFPGGFWKIHTFYEGAAAPERKIHASDEEWTQHIAHLERWTKQYPDSITARVALGKAYDGWGWSARGGGYADTVTDGGWKLLAERGQKALEIMTEADKLPEKCPEWFMEMLTLARTQGWEEEQAIAMLKRAVAFEPDFYYYYRFQADSLLPKWGGNEGDAARFADAIADHIGGKNGDMMYFEIAASINCACSNKSGLNGMAWPRILSGYNAVNEQFGQSMYNVNAMAYMAFQAHDLINSHQLFQQIGENWSKELWLSHERFDNMKHLVWVNTTAAEYKEAIKNAKTPEGQVFAANLEETINKNYQDKFRECVKASPGVKFSFMMELTSGGKAHEIVFPSANIPDACLRPELEKGVFAAPPHGDYWVLVAVNVN
jgi:hypothetical protein